MFTRIKPTTDSQLSNDDVANLIVDDAITKLAQLTDLSKEQAFALLSKQVNGHLTKQVGSSPKVLEQPILEHSEFKYISSLFN